jgi:single-strand DNA-binding protein
VPSKEAPSGGGGQRSYETREGDKRTVYEIEADDVAASLKFASAKVTKATRSSAQGQCGGQGNGGGRDQSDPWASDAPGGYSDEPPFRGARESPSWPG